MAADLPPLSDEERAAIEDTARAVVNEAPVGGREFGLASDTLAMCAAVRALAARVSSLEAERGIVQSMEANRAEAHERLDALEAAAQEVRRAAVPGAVAHDHGELVGCPGCALRAAIDALAPVPVTAPGPLTLEDLERLIERHEMAARFVLSDHRHEIFARDSLTLTAALRSVMAERDAASADFKRLREERDEARAAFAKWTRDRAAAGDAYFHNTGGGAEPDCPLSHEGEEDVDGACTCGLSDLVRLLGEAPCSPTT